MLLMEDESERKYRAEGLIRTATDSTAAEVDPRLLKAIKSVVRYSDSELRVAAETLMSLMKRDHSQVRYLALLIIDELFMRSKLFRTLLVEDLDLLLSLSVGFRSNLQLPPPASIASILRSKAIELLEKWNETFGIHYRKLRLGYDYLKNTLRFQFPNLQANAARIQQQRREREMRTKEILLKKFATLKDNIVSVKEEIQSTIEEIGECFDIVKIDDEEDIILDEEEMDEFRNAELRQIRLDSLKESEKVQENMENKVIFDTLRELYKVLMTKHLAAIQEWISLLVRVETADTRFRDNTLKEFIDIKNRILFVKRKYEDLGCSLEPKMAYEEEEEEDIWEEGSLEPSVSGKSSTTFSQGNNGPAKSTSNNVRTEEPIIGNEKKSNGTGKENYNSSKPKSNDDRAEIQPCRAPLRKGGLCQRQDLRICPFHGHIIPRDDDGEPINQSSSVEEKDDKDKQEEGTSDLGSEMMKKILNQAVKNIRERDKEEVKKREDNKKALKRARLATIREHNEAVLRDAAIASTSRSAHIGEDNGSNNSKKRKKQTPASMLKKKKGGKGRLAQILLNTRPMSAINP